MGSPIAALQLVFSALIPLTQAGGEKEHHAHLGHLRGLEAQRAQLQPAGGLVAGAADHQHRHQQQDGRQHDKGRNPPQPLVVEFGGHIHDDQPHHREGGLALEIEGGVVVGDLLHRRSIGGGGQQHDQPDAQQQQHQGQEGQIHRPPGQLLLPGQIPFLQSVPWSFPLSIKGKQWVFFRSGRAGFSRSEHWEPVHNPQ